ncbi:MAG: TolC family protein [Candidatus Cellulosilyticum pullistercoris]|uniref:TolC family protein n=1 Tax=Candidatus Cellulosilyticum pullistercoris TaxID=2838521 RepID=A0A9E2KBG0_9FIRM|nr:TolC family protein [Candidatus Cellulosilyticum pullistercoris]
MNKKMMASLLIASLTVSQTVYATTTKNSLNASSETSAENQIASEVEEVNAEEENLLTLNEAVSYGLEHSILLEKIKNQADIAKLVKDNAIDIRNDLIEADLELSNAYYLIDDGRDEIYDGEAQLDSAQTALDNGIAPQDIPVAQLGITIPAGSHIRSYLENVVSMAYPDAPSAQVDAIVEGAYSQIISTVQGILDTNSDQLTSSKKKLEASTQSYLSSKSQYDAALQYAMSNVANKLSTSTISSLKTKPLTDLIIKMADTQDEVTSYSINIYKNKIALLIQNSYYNALKEQKLLEVKQKAVERGKLQYELAKAAYEVGAKSKDDLILAKTYYDSTVMSEELQLKDYNAALLELKTNMNMDLSKDIKLKEVDVVTDDESFDLTQGIRSGLKSRLEMKMAEAQVDLYKYLMTAVDESDYSSSSNQYKESKLLQQKADIERSATALQVESDIRTSYATMTSMQKIAAKSKELEAGAKETVEIAKVKYEVGFGYDNALLAQMNLESMSGTLVEVIAAEENLVSIQEKEIEAVNGYNLSRLKYLNDIGILPYK